MNERADTVKMLEEYYNELVKCGAADAANALRQQGQALVIAEQQARGGGADGAGGGGGGGSSAAAGKKQTALKLSSAVSRSLKQQLQEANRTIADLRTQLAHQKKEHKLERAELLQKSLAFGTRVDPGGGTNKNLLGGSGRLNLATGGGPEPSACQHWAGSERRHRRGGRGEVVAHIYSGRRGCFDEEAAGRWWRRRRGHRRRQQRRQRRHAVPCGVSFGHSAFGQHPAAPRIGEGDPHSVR